MRRVSELLRWIPNAAFSRPGKLYKQVMCFANFTTAERVGGRFRPDGRRRPGVRWAHSPES
jgi:hypothetical protein